jgi:hypothetical protein
MAQPYPSTSRGYNSSFRGANSPGAFYEVMQGDFGSAIPAAPSLAYNAGAGSLGATTARIGVTWITAAGESAISTEATVSVSSGSGAVTVTQPTVPANGAAIVGWRVYSSSGSAGSALLNTAALSTTQAQTTFTTSAGIISGFAIATTAVQVLIYGTGQAEPTTDASGIQAPLPSVGANTSVDYYFRVPNTASLWRTQKDANYVRPQGYADPTGITVGACDVIMPLYPGTSASVSLGGSMVMNGYLYLATTAGTTASTFPGGAAFNQAQSKTTTDGTVVWTSYGKAVQIRLRFTNGSGTAAIPQAQEYDFFTL